MAAIAAARHTHVRHTSVMTIYGERRGCYNKATTYVTLRYVIAEYIAARQSIINTVLRLAPSGLPQRQFGYRRHH